MGKVYFLDVTNRDGVQASRLEMSKFQRTMVNCYLGADGHPPIGVWFPFIWLERNYLNANLELAGKRALWTIRIRGWCRAVVGDVEKLAIKRCRSTSACPSRLRIR